MQKNKQATVHLNNLTRLYDRTENTSLNIFKMFRLYISSLNEITISDD